VRFGEVLSSTGLPWQNAFEVVVAVDGKGQPDATRAEQGANIFKPLAGAGAARAPPPPAPTGRSRRFAAGGRLAGRQ
jgi:hypothetical protein